MADWYYSEAEEQVGPVSEEKLQRLVSVGTVTRETLVWTEGMKDWKPAGEVPLLFGDAEEAGDSGPPRRSGRARSGGAGARGKHVDSHLAKAIIVTLLCCMPFGIAAIVFASQVSSKLAAGDYEGAVESSRKADQWANWGMIIGILITVIGVGAQLVFLGGSARFGG